MDLYCPRCAAPQPQVDAETLALGLCALCSGQLTTGPIPAHAELQAVAMEFSDGSGVGKPLRGAFESSSISGDGASDDDGGFDVDLGRDTTPPGGITLPAPAAAPAPLRQFDMPEPMKFPEGEVPAMPGAASGDAGGFEADLGGGSELPPPPSIDEGSLPPPPAIGDDFGIDMSDGADTAASPAGAAAPAPGADEVGSGADPSPGEAGGAEVPAHLALPSMDFSLPSLDLGGMGASGAATAAASTPGDLELPAHLQLPSFPELSLDFNAGPAETPLATPPGEAQAGMPPPPPGASAPPPMPAHLQPPPPPTPRKRAAPPAPPPVAAASTLPSLPNLGALPPLPGAQAKHEVTLMGETAAAEIADQLKTRSSAGLIVVLVLLLLGGVGGVGYWKRDLVLSYIAPQKKQVAMTAQDKARAAFAEGVKADKNNQSAEALRHYKAAVDADPALSAAQLRLAIAYAKAKQEADAVEHYRAYVKLEPKAPDAEGVRKIIADWEKAQAEKKKETAANDDKAGKGKKKRRK